MNKLLRIALILAVIGAVAAALVWKFYINKPHTDIEKAQPAYSLSADQLWKEYNGDLRTADSLYTGKVIEVSGTVGATETGDSLTYVVFIMEADSMFGNKSIRCEMLPKFAGGIQPGEPGTVKGYCNGYDQTDIKLSKCSIVK